MEKGRESAIIETAKKMKQDGLSYENISKYTGLSIEKLNDLKI